MEPSKTEAVSARSYTWKLHTVDIRIGNVYTPAAREKFHSDAVRFNGVVSTAMDYQMKRARIYTKLPKIKEDLIVYLMRKGYDVLSPEHGSRYKEKDNVEHNLTPAYFQGREDFFNNLIAQFKKEREE